MIRIALILILLCGQAWGQAVRLKDLVDVEGVRGNDLIGYGIVVGLNGSGDSLRNAPYTEEALISLLERLGVNMQDETFRPDNVAAVIVTATLPPFSRAGSRIDVAVSSIGDAESLQGGLLVMTPLLGADNRVYAVAQGPLAVGGFDVQGAAGSASQGSPTLGTIAGGARVEAEVGFRFADMKVIRLALRDPDFTTARRIEATLQSSLGAGVVMTDAGTVEIDTRRTGLSAPQLIAAIEGTFLTPARKARVVIDQRSGTIVLGENVRIAPVAVAQGALTIRVAETPVASQPGPFADGNTVVLPRTSIAVSEGVPGDVTALEAGASLQDLVEGLNALDVPPQDMIEIFEALKAAGALHAEIVVQ
ncbi:flagellar basal body P-ring protein FlgI [Parvularcula sp. ZS-1/3]|uniref:Flagellar P-ring protein n=1 Tax=Parvularcula mediterranea TaxID=2732508 RepID=A0A7Y3RJV4_9PROT|nr:flagellar basal body P-ring protein FlgI [Parvularcula mediterranea]NNU15361.1 flagellar basal body P-ring protein FlgI [Parvularcula mediterranea]